MLEYIIIAVCAAAVIGLVAALIIVKSNMKSQKASYEDKISSMEASCSERIKSQKELYDKLLEQQKESVNAQVAAIRTEMTARTE